MTSKTLLSKRHGFINQFLPVYVFIAFSFLSLNPGTELVKPTQAQTVTHPFLIVKESDYPALQAKTASLPWSKWKTNAISKSALTYDSAASDIRSKAFRMRDIVSGGALAYILETDATTRATYRNRVVAALKKWDLLATLATSGDGNDSHGFTGSALLNSVLALDIIYNDISAADRTEIETKIGRLFTITIVRNGVTQLWVNKTTWNQNNSAMKGIWELYKTGTTTQISAYKAALYAAVNQDGSYSDGPGYAGQRMDSTFKEAKAHFLDVLEFTGKDHTFYSDDRLTKLYEWIYGYSITPSRIQSFVLGDASTASIFSVIGAGRYKAYRFYGATETPLAAQYAARLPNSSNNSEGLLLHYVLSGGKSLPAAAIPKSRIFPNAGAWLLDGSLNDLSLGGVLWNPTKDENFHMHYEVNALALAAYGQTVIRNIGGAYSRGTTCAAGTPRLEHYQMSYNAKESNTVLINGENHVSKHGAGITEAITTASFDYASGDSGTALAANLPNPASCYTCSPQVVNSKNQNPEPSNPANAGKHIRNFVFVHPQDGKNGYWLLFDEVTLNTSGKPVNVSLHPNSDTVTSSVAELEYKWQITENLVSVTGGSTVYLNIFLGTPPDLSEIKDGPMASDINCNFWSKYLYSTYNTTSTKKNIVTVIFPSDAAHIKAPMARVTGTGYSGANIDLGAGVTDTALESQGTSLITNSGVSFKGQAAYYRNDNGKITSYFVRKGSSFDDGSASEYGFSSNLNISVYLKGAAGKIISPGAEVTFYYPNITSVLLNGIAAAQLGSGTGWVKVTVPAGTYDLELKTGTLSTVSTPTFSPAAGTYTSTQNVTISSATAGATIYYTLDGTDPASSATRAIYASAIAVSATKTIKAKAFKTGMNPSVTSQATYTINLSAVAAPAFSPAGGTYTSAQNVTISTATAGATIHYTINGTTPTEASPIYSTAIAISSTTTLKAGAWKTGMTPSAIASAAYTINTSVNLAPNPGFESAPSLNYLYYGTGTFTWASDYFHAGAKSLKIVSSQATGVFARWVSKVSNIGAVAGQTYIASVWMKTSGVTQYGELLINFWDSNQVYLNKYYISPHVSGTSNWTQLTVSGIAPANTKYVRAEFRLYGPGTIWVDDVQLQ